MGLDNRDAFECDARTDNRGHTLTVKSLNLQHRNERREDLGFGSLHHLLVGLQDALQDQGERRQDVGSGRHHTAHTETAKVIVKWL